jgi:DNA polymerase-3 subunit chi
MSRVDFYVLTNNVTEGKLRFTCRLVHKIYNLGKSAYIHAASEDQAQRLDDLMWTFDQSSFLPHGRHADSYGDEPQAPIMIGHEPPSEVQSADVLISLLESAPVYADRFDRVAELVDNDPQEKQSARERFRQYRERGFELETHQVFV